jgi:NAD-dependent dihydropyrimidine dehydrogenase PreA subunit
MAGRDYMGFPREQIPWYPTIQADLCTGCGSCLEFCSNDVFELGDDGVMQVINPYNCVVGCTSCAKMCPVDAITFPAQQELVALLRKLRQERKQN